MAKIPEIIELEDQVVLAKNRLDKAQQALNEADEIYRDTRIQRRDALRQLREFRESEMNLVGSKPREYELTGSD